MENENKRIIEVNGVKIEVDMREAKTVDTYKVGDNVKILVKEYSDYKSCPGVIAGFDVFQSKPTIIVAYLNISYNEAKVQFAYITPLKNGEESKYELCPCNEYDIAIEKGETTRLMDNEIEKKEAELHDLKKKKEYFLNHFRKYFKEIE